ncbi:EscU/YscU/HrcU family type III secretion system export apparatus switch protein [Erwinia pyrifoliae]|uniref:EscU/YscU/HrcU family type III secretion system export apparatus switch protein n=1 Tax=Erwinia pyrifoliae TaxID=79967 RepID=A0ABY5XD37_ERWPY|nr:EscU/YscU/HrcU family type III secretion system export apparatus switch protein [Erwinia pyrifoliae]AUX72543.1 EscU/YscU/HrcU family type III secretion system export apparatus switch protein [Erwinia pyrifoliae]MCA8877203.1 EscU/YscU/HrcU family type III secretion system export apparatus switch protein [Erwinia pyrifoliae]MCT2387386.1 EscU/YscU/HrcU family type III secretion system export apparatus switch protein [Erwinia pyrifoliae]MCU8587014.1 EscU/YscU/HrcU family type III secretion syste
MAQKTELPTEKKRKDSAKKGQSLKIKDFITTVTLISGSYFLLYGMDFSSFISYFSKILLNENSVNIDDFMLQMMYIFLQLSFPLIGVCCLSGIIATLFQTRFTIATQALKLNFKALNPVEGIKKIFSMRTVKEFIKSLCYLMVFLFTCYNFITNDLKHALVIHHAGIGQLIVSLLSLTVKAVTIFIAYSLFVLCADFIMEYFLHVKDLKMDKHEVKQEHKESDGNPQIKSARRRAHQELLSGEEMAAVRNSSVVMANPTHIAMAIYFNPQVASLPFIALRASNFKAKAALLYAEEIGIPVVRNVLLTRRLYKSYVQYSFISINDDDLMAVMDILIWLRQVEIAGMESAVPSSDVTSDELLTDE